MTQNIWIQIEESLTTHPDQRAWVKRLPAGGHETFRYHQIREYTLDLATRLRADGVVPGDVVGVMSPNGPEWAVAALALWKIGAVVAPIHIGNSSSEIHIQVDALSPKLNLVFEGKERLPNQVNIELESSGERITKEEGEPTTTTSEDEAVRIYTSGSTGNPKMVCLTHGNFLHQLAAAPAVIDLGVNDRFLSLLPVSHAMGLTADLLLPIHSGSTIFLPKKLAAEEVLAAMAEEEITAVVAVPRLFRNIMLGLQKKLSAGSPLLRGYVNLIRAVPWGAKKILNAPLRRKLGGEITMWVSGGSRLDPEIARFFRGLGIPLRQGYGLTETAPVVSIQEENDPLFDSVGKALPGVEVEIFNPDSSGSGEIRVRGPNVMSGYTDDVHNREAFDAGWFCTGDIGRLDKEGRIIITGRAKRLIVTEAGKNVYPEDLEIELERAPVVKEAGVLEVEMRPVAVMAIDSDDPVAEAKEVLRAYNKKMSGHNQISRFALVDELPRTPLGKVALKLLDAVFEENEVKR